MNLTKIFKYRNTKIDINTKKIYLDLKLYKFYSRIKYISLIKNKE